MMGPEIIAAVLAGAGGYIASMLAARLSRGKARSLTIQAPGESPELIKVEGPASASEIVDAVRRAVNFEQLVEQHLRKSAEKTWLQDVSRGRRADFVVRVGEKSIVIEAKADLGHLGRSDVLSYLNSEPGAEKFILVSKHKPPAQLRKSVEDLVRSKQVRFVYPGSDRTVEAVLDKALQAEAKSSEA